VGLFGYFGWVFLGGFFKCQPCSWCLHIRIRWVPPHSLNSWSTSSAFSRTLLMPPYQNQVNPTTLPLQLVHILGIFQDTPDASISESGESHHIPSTADPHPRHFPGHSWCLHIRIRWVPPHYLNSWSISSAFSRTLLMPPYQNQVSPTTLPLQLVHILGISQDTPDASISESGESRQTPSPAGPHPRHFPGHSWCRVSRHHSASPCSKWKVRDKGDETIRFDCTSQTSG
jgi:hypothetical protein